MFADLKYYADQEYWRAHPSIYLACEKGAYRYDIYSAPMRRVSAALFTISGTGRQPNGRSLLTRA